MNGLPKFLEVADETFLKALVVANLGDVIVVGDKHV